MSFANLRAIPTFVHILTKLYDTNFLESILTIKYLTQCLIFYTKEKSIIIP